MGAVCATEPVALPLALALQEDDLSERLEALNLAECLEQEAARRARLQAAAFHALLALPELARGLCVLWGLKTSRCFAAVAKNGGKSVRGLLPNLHEEAVPQFYVMGGCLATTELASAQHYNPETNSWKLLPPMPTERRWCAGAALKGWLYVIGGQQEGHILPTAERFDVETGRWEALPDMPTCREACAVASCASYLYVLGGCQHDVPLSVAERLHVEDLCWESLTEMPCSRDACAATALQGRVYVAGGRSSGHFLASADVLEGGATATVRWSRLPPMPTARLGCFAAAARSSVYVAGGHAGRGRALAIIERFDVAEYFWELLTNMPSARLGAVSLCWQPSQLRGRDLHLYIFGGHNGQGAVDLAERLELESDGISNPRWERLPSMITPCYSSAGAVLAW
ncbi:unnamed protein product [Durusdinium trenchii]|uniref:Uncharacterized protein n=1 Tax=Durusdinium trenchii TaxID=1381693 RepID=A0ABP0P0S3_9DINO